MTPAEAIWIEASPRDPATALATPVLLAGGGQDLPYRHPVDRRQFRAGIVSRPLFSAQLGFDETGWTGTTRPQTCTVAFSTADPTLRAQLAAFVWKWAPVTIEAGPEGQAPSRILTGKIEDAEFTRAGMTLTIVDLTEKLDAPVATGRFDGSGGIGGPAEAAGRVKRRSYGYVFNVEGRLIDAANSVYEFGDPAFGFAAWSGLRDKGRDGPFAVLAWQGSIAATFAALQASEPERGGGVVAPSIACAKWWTQPSGPLTADFIGSAGTGGSMQPAAIADAISRLAGGPTVADLVAANALRPGIAGIHVASDRETFAQAIDRVLQGVSLLWLPRPDGTIAIRPWEFDDDAPLLQAEFRGRSRTFPPHGKRRIGFQRNERIHNEGEIAGILLEELRDGGAELAREDLLNAHQEWGQVQDGVGTRPEDNATVGAPPGTLVGDRPAEQVTSDLDQHTAQIAAAESSIVEAQGDIDGLIATYGDTESAAQSAAAALASKNAAEAAEQLAAEHETNAGLAEQNAIDAKAAAEAAEAGAANQAGIASSERELAQTARTAAEGFRDEALTAKQDAEAAEATATTQAGISASAATASEAARDQTVIENGNNDFLGSAGGWGTSHITGAGSIQDRWHVTYDGHPGVILSSLGEVLNIGHQRVYPVEPGRVYRLRARARSVAAGVTFYLGCYNLDETGAVLGPNPDPILTQIPVANGWQDFERVYGSDFRPGTKSIRLIAILNRDAVAGQGALDGLWFEDITERVAAENYASASADSAAIATAQADVAGQSAQAASSAKLGAETAESNAQTYRNEAADARDDAAGSAASASQSEAVVAESRKKAEASLSTTFPKAMDPSLFGGVGGAGSPYDFIGLEDSGHTSWIAPDRSSLTFPAGTTGTYHRGVLKSEPGRVYRMYADVEIIDDGGQAGVYVGFYGRALTAEYAEIGGLAWYNLAGGSATMAEGQRQTLMLDLELTAGYSAYVWLRPTFLLNRMPGTTAGNSNAVTRLHALWVEDITESVKAEESAIAAASSEFNAAASEDEAGNHAATASQASGLAVEAKNDAQAAATASQGSAASATADAAAAAASAQVSARYSTRGPGDSFNGAMQSATGWYGDRDQTAPQPESRFITSSRGRAFISDAGSRALVVGERMTVDTSRKYRVAAGVWNGTSGESEIYIGFVSYDSSGNFLVGNPGTYSYPAAQAVILNSTTYRTFDSADGGPITGEGTGSHQFPVGTKSIAPLAFLNYDQSPGVQTAMNRLYVEDITGQVDADSAASIAEAQAVSAGNSAAAAQADRQLTATYRQNALDASSAAQASAGTAESEAAVATAQAAAAQQSAVLAASLAQGLRNPNSGFDDYPNATGLPSHWVNWIGASTAAQRIADDLGGYSLRIAAAANTNIGFASVQSPSGVVQINDYVILIADITLNSGSFAGAGIMLRVMDAGANGLNNLYYPFSTTPDASGVAPGNGVVGKRYTFPVLIEIPYATADRVQVYGINHHTNVGSIAAANNITWHQAGWRPATPLEVQTGTVLPALEATVSSQGQVLQDLDTSFASLQSTVQAQGVTVSEHTTAINEVEGDVENMAGMWGLNITIDGVVVGGIKLDGTSAGSTLKFISDLFSVESSDGLGLQWTDGILWNRGASTSVIIGENFGASNDLLFWAGATPATTGAASKGNGVFWIDSSGDAYFGGSLSAGDLKNSAQSSAKTADASVTIGPFGTNGNPILVVASFNMRSTSQANYPATNQGRQDWENAVAAFGGTVSGTGQASGSRSISGDIDATVERVVGGSTTSNWTTLSINSGSETIRGSRPEPLDMVGGYLIYDRYFSGSTTKTDNAGGLLDRTFTATLTNRLGWSGTITAQSLSLVSTEE